MVVKHIKAMFERFTGKSKGDNKKAPAKPPVVQIDVKDRSGEKGKMALQVVTLEKFQDTEGILESLRSSHRILLVKIAPLKEKDMTELKRAINRFKTHCAATGADLAAIDDNWVILVPPMVGLERV